MSMRIEIESLDGYVVAEGRRAGVGTPKHDPRDLEPLPKLVP